MAVGRGRLGRLPGDRLGLGRDGLAVLVADGLGDGVAVLVADGFGDGVAVGVAEEAGEGSALGVELGVADGDEAVAEADGEGLGSAIALTGRMTAAPAARRPTTARTAVRAPTSIRPPSLPTPGQTIQAMTKSLYTTRTTQAGSHGQRPRLPRGHAWAWHS